MKIEIDVHDDGGGYWEARADFKSSCFAFGTSPKDAVQNLLETIFMELAVRAADGGLPFEDGMTLQLVLRRPDPK